MKNFSLIQASANASGVFVDKLQEIAEAGFKLSSPSGTAVKMPMVKDGKLRKYCENITISLTGLNDLVHFIELVGKVIVGVDTLTIYDDYVE